MKGMSRWYDGLLWCVCVYTICEVEVEMEMEMESGNGSGNGNGDGSGNGSGNGHDNVHTIQQRKGKTYLKCNVTHQNISIKLGRNTSVSYVFPQKSQWCIKFTDTERYDIEKLYIFLLKESNQTKTHHFAELCFLLIVQNWIMQILLKFKRKMNRANAQLKKTKQSG